MANSGLAYCFNQKLLFYVWLTWWTSWLVRSSASASLTIHLFGGPFLLLFGRWPEKAAVGGLRLPCDSPPKGECATGLRPLQLAGRSPASGTDLSPRLSFAAVRKRGRGASPGLRKETQGVQRSEADQYLPKGTHCPVSSTELGVPVHRATTPPHFTWPITGLPRTCIIRAQ